MKTTITPVVKEKGFEPFVINITVENEDEARFFWNLFSLSDSRLNEVIKENSGCSVNLPSRVIESLVLWDAIDNKVEMMGMKEK